MGVSHNLEKKKKFTLPDILLYIIGIDRGYLYRIIGKVKHKH